jgi:transcriptional regulator
MLASKNISAYRLAKETGISESLFSKWKSKPTSEISSSNLARIADYLDCSVDYLLGRTENPEVNK